MRKKQGCAVMLIVAPLLFGFPILFSEVVPLPIGERMAKVSLTIGGKATTSLLAVDIEKACMVRLGVEFDVRPGEKNYGVEQDFRFRYTAFDEHGRQIGSGTYSKPNLNFTPICSTYEFYGSPYCVDVGPPGKIRIEAEIGPGSCEPKLKSAELIVKYFAPGYPDGDDYLCVGRILVWPWLLSLPIFFSGFIFFVYGLFTDKKKVAEQD